MRDRVYLDHNASAPLLPESRAVMMNGLDIGANASSVHAEGRKARGMIENARRSVAALANAAPENVVFTSGATEAATTLLTPNWHRGRAAFRTSRLYVSAADHPCILGGGRFAPGDVEILSVDENGLLNPAAFTAALADHDADAGVPLVAIHHANNETGVVQPVRELGAVVRAAGGIMVVDAVQSAGRIPLDISEGYADFLIISSHKIGGPKGAGAIIGTSDAIMPFRLVTGGGQEKGHRGGTENIAAIAGFGVAARTALEGLGAIEKIRALRDHFEEAIVSHLPDAVFFGRDAERIANTSFFAIPGTKAETAQIAFDLAGVALSAGSACSSGKVGPSHVLAAMGQGNDTSALRVSIGPGTNEADLAAFEEALAGIAARRRSAKAA